MSDNDRRVTFEEIATVVTKLKATTSQLRGRGGCNITKLVVLKRLCEDPIAAAQFGLYLASRVQTKTAKKYKPLVREGLRQLKAHLAEPRKVASESLWTALHALEDSQNEVEHHRWADVRIIHSREALLAEYALRIAARRWESTFWGYRMAAYYVERYDSRFGTGLIPPSLPALEDIIRFWSRYAASRHVEVVSKPAEPGTRATAGGRVTRSAARHRG